jgi:hypothetical protein
MACALQGIGVLLLSVAGCTAPTQVQWSDHLVVDEPTAPPQGGLDAYSERCVAWDGNVPRVTRRAVNVYSIDGQLVAHARAQDGENPIRFTLSPGDYVVTSEDQLQWRRVQVEVKDGQDPVVAESQWDTAPPLASSGANRPDGGSSTHRSDVSFALRSGGGHPPSREYAKG